MELLLIPAAIASGCHRPLLRWWKTARPCTAKVSANGSELRAICGRLVVITACIKCTAVVLLDAVATNFVGKPTTRHFVESRYLLYPEVLRGNTLLAHVAILLAHVVILLNNVNMAGGKAYTLLCYRAHKTSGS